MPIDADALERLRKLRRLGVRRGAGHLDRPDRSAQPAAPAMPGLPGQPVDTAYGPAWACATRYPLQSHPDLAPVLAASPAALAALGREPALAGLDPSRAAFIDTETTGLSLGTGTYTFLIGVGVYEDLPGDPAFVVYQFLMRDPGEERAQLHLVEEALGRCTGIVSFNGRGFDLPLLQNRFILASAPLPLAGAPHLDLLPPARRIWRPRLGSCSLGELERNILGVQRTEADVPGWMIPGIYRDFYANPGPANRELMARVFYHNLQDIVSMALLSGRMVAFFAESEVLAGLQTLHPLECAALARCYQDLAWNEPCESAYRLALAASLPAVTRSELLRDLSLWLKHCERREDAVAVWETWISTDAGEDLLPYVELAKHHEWHSGDLAAARGWAAWALRIAEAAGPAAIPPDTRAELERRLARIERKLATRSQ